MSEIILGKKDLEYPRPWCYRIIVEREALSVQAEIGKIMRDRNLDATALTPAGASGGGRYVVYQLICEVSDRDDMSKLGNDLASIKGVKMVI